MSRYKLTPVFALTVIIPVLASGQGPDSEFYATPKTVPEFWRAARFELRTGNYERAAERIKGLLDLNPDEKTLFDLVDKPTPGNEVGLAQFLKLRNVPVWNSSPAKNKEAKERVEELISKLSKALESELNNPERIRRFANALAGPPEESTFALKELRRSGKAVPPVLTTMLGEELTDDVRAGILSAIPLLSLDTVPGFVTFLPAAKPTVQAELIDGLRAREDYRALMLGAETDPVPTLWYLWGNPNSPEAIKTKARDGIVAATLKDPTLERDAELRTPHGQLAAIARRFYMGTDNLQRLATDAKGEPGHNVWVWDGKTLKQVAMTRNQAIAHYGLRYARWALELQADYAPAQKVFFGLAIDDHVARGGGRPLEKTGPDLYAALVTAPFPLLAELLEESIRDKKTATVFAIVRALAERTEIKAGRSEGKAGASTSPERAGRPSLFVKALDYPDPRVQFAAADGLLRIPGPPTHGRSSQIVKILAAALAADEPADGKPKVLLGDPDAIRAEGFASVLQRVGFEVEVVRTGRQLMRRIQEKADADLIIVDRHLPDPMLTDLLPQLRADRRARTLPLMVVASPDGVTPVNLFTALARLATAVAFEDLLDNPAIKFPEEQVGAKKGDLVEQVEHTFEEMGRLIIGRHAAQMRRMQEIVEKAGFSLTEEMKNRIEYLSLQTFPPAILNTFVPSMLDQERIVVRRLLPPLVLEEAGENPTPALKGKIRGDELPSREQAERIVKLMNLTSEIELRVPVDRMPAFRKVWDAFWDPVSPKLPPSSPVRHPEIEAKLTRMTAPYKGVRVIPAVLSEISVRDELAQTVDPKSPMVTAAEKKENAKTAMVWLRKMAVGEVTGYQLADAEVAIRGALKSDELAPLAIDALVKLPSKEGQLDLANLAVAPERPVPIRSQAAAALVEHVQAFGKFVTGPQTDAIAQSAGTAEDAELRARLLAVHGVLKSDAKSTGERLKGYTPKPVEPAKPKDEPKEEKKE